MIPVEVQRGTGPVVLSFPHAGTWLPADVKEMLRSSAKSLVDTDWYVDRIYQGLLTNVTMVRANFHRYLVDANRDPAGNSLYPGQNTTELVPTTDFDGMPLWKKTPTKEQVAERVSRWHLPYHQHLSAELDRVYDRHGVVILLDCHSIRSQIPYLFAGRLPDLNVGTNGGTTCAIKIESAVQAICERAESFTSVLNGRFRGGWTTRFYGRPSTGRHAIQLELSQATYLEDEGTDVDYKKADQLRTVLKKILEALQNLAFELAGKVGEKA